MMSRESGASERDAVLLFCSEGFVHIVTQSDSPANLPRWRLQEKPLHHEQEPLNSRACPGRTGKEVE